MPALDALRPCPAFSPRIGRPFIPRRHATLISKIGHAPSTARDSHFAPLCMIRPIARKGQYTAFTLRN
ncbi:hypothetical protein CCC_03250 [Paramagnetospirillum magnetotacticum MS-1]|uniref:Uncharacterized protein n=1 Tax=Paramagnetospirillum magnetotacticum MS-1 TaxID=272627 RepID=A0A0C2UGI5_PARME|nr:hypothetical protein CCC_03250 [Paramagnetospirillum magnetotacticum MS-1]